jgi:hypothetical protein
VYHARRGIAKAEVVGSEREISRRDAERRRGGRGEELSEESGSQAIGDGQAFPGWSRLLATGVA